LGSQYLGGSRFIESPNFPINDVNEASASEKRGGGRPGFWEMVFWWTRKPLAGARGIIAGALLPSSVGDYEFKQRLGYGEGVAHRKKPSPHPGWAEVFKRARLLDPFAGFGSIPLEAVRLGVGDIVAVELLPTAYVFLKAVLEHPKWVVDRGLGHRLVRDVERWGMWVAKELEKDPGVAELYDRGVAVYIGSWEVRCPHCGSWTPLVGNWWLARVKGRGSGEEEGGGGSGEYRRIAWMEPARLGDRIDIRVRDLNKETGSKTLRVSVKEREIRIRSTSLYIPEPNIEARKEVARCLLCNNAITNKNKRGGEWYVKESLKEWNQNLERYLRGEIRDKELLNSRARPRLLVRVRIAGGDLEFEPATQEDNEKLWRALEKLRQIWGDPDIPTESIAPYGARYLFAVLYGFDKWFKLFNPRQLLTLVKLVKLIREAGKRVEEEKLKEGWSKEEAHRYAEAVTTYLAIALVRYADYNCYNTMVDSANPWGVKIAHALSTRGIAMQWNWGDTNPLLGSIRVSGILQDTSTLYRALDNVIGSLSYLVSAVSGSPSRVRVVLDNATVLSKLGSEKFDIIVTDPPYRDDVPYAELSDFYYVWLKRALSDVVDVAGIPVRAPRFYPEAFFSDGAEVETQWQHFASKEVSEDEGRSKFFGRGVGSFEHFKELLVRSFRAMASRLSDGGVVVTYYAHTSPEAWEALLEAGWRGAGLKITATHTVVTESEQRVTARGKAGIDVSVVVVWRKGSSGEALVGDVYARAVERCSGKAGEYIRYGYKGVNLFVAVLGCVLSEFTSYREIVGVRDGVGQLVKDYIYPATAESIARSLGAGSIARPSPEGLFYLLAKILIPRGLGQAVRAMDRSSFSILAIGTRCDQKRLEALAIVKRDGDRIALLEPRWDAIDLRAAAESALKARGVIMGRPAIRSSIDALHILEYLSISLPKDRFREEYEKLRLLNPAAVEEAIALAGILAASAEKPDPERGLATRLLEAVGMRSPEGLGRWAG